jgi:hypothetical protein
MRRVLYTLLGTLLFACGPWAQEQSHVVSSEKVEKRRTIYVKINGPQEAAAQLRGSFAEAAEEKGLLLAEDPHKAGTKVDVTIKEQNAEGTLYAELISATLTSRDGKSATVYSCKSVGDGKGYSTITKKTGKTSLIQSDIASKGTVFVEETTARNSAGLVESIKKEIAAAGFQVAATEKEADISLKDIKLIKKSVRAMSVEGRTESRLSTWSGQVINLSSKITSYKSIVEPIGAEAEVCRSSMKSISEDGSRSYQGVAVTDLAVISQQLK